MWLEEEATARCKQHQPRCWCFVSFISVSSWSHVINIVHRYRNQQQKVLCCHNRSSSVVRTSDGATWLLFCLQTDSPAFCCQAVAIRLNQTAIQAVTPITSFEKRPEGSPNPDRSGLMLVKGFELACLDLYALLPVLKFGVKWAVCFPLTLSHWFKWHGGYFFGKTEISIKMISISINNLCGVIKRFSTGLDSLGHLHLEATEKGESFFH